MASLVLAVLVGLIALYQFLRRMRAEERAAHASAELQNLREELEPLRRYEAIADVDREIAARTGELANAEREAQREVAKLRADAREILDAAQAEHGRVVAAAEQRAREIAGDAFDARGKLALYEDAAKAVKNVVDGYGDAYVVPNRSALDDLADEVSHKEAGVELKGARARTKGMVQGGNAAECDYVETQRRETAIRFVIDAFNGKVDSTLSKVRHDNFGKLAQEIRDAAALVNLNGKAFRNARIQPAYVDARLDELRWAVAANELKLEEREEQRRIKEAMREEERARREYERARKEAEKEERMLRKAMEEARRQLGAAAEAERAALEEQLADLASKLAEAEAREQRALSMAQQTKRGHVYVISNIGSFGDGMVKVGLTRRLEPMDRVKELGDASVPFEFDVHAMIPSDDAPALEAELHRRFDDRRVNPINRRKEFFFVSIAELKSVAETLELDVHWTLVAEAREWREAQALRASR